MCSQSAITISKWVNMKAGTSCKHQILPALTHICFWNTGNDVAGLWRISLILYCYVWMILIHRGNWNLGDNDHAGRPLTANTPKTIGTGR